MAGTVYFNAAKGGYYDRATGQPASDAAMRNSGITPPASAPSSPSRASSLSVATPAPAPAPAASSRPTAPTLSTPLGKNGYVDPQYRMDINVKHLGQVAPLQSLQSQYETQLGAINPDRAGLDAFKSEALRTGPSAWLNMSRDQANTGLTQDLSDTAQSGMGAAATARSSLAAKHGLSSGAAERVASDSGINTLLNQQKLRAGNATNLSNLGIQDETNRLGMLSQLPGQELNYANFDLGKQLQILGNADKERMQAHTDADQYRTDMLNAYKQDIGNSVNALGGKTAFDSGMYGQDMQEWAANQQANAMGQQQPGMFSGMSTGQLAGLGGLVGGPTGAMVGAVGKPATNVLGQLGIGGGSGGGGGSVVCTHYNSIGWITDEMLRGDEQFGRDHATLKEKANYLAWGRPLVALMVRYPILAYILWPIFYHWTHYMAWKTGHSEHKPMLGRLIVEGFCRPVSNFIGSRILLSRRKSRNCKISAEWSAGQRTFYREA